MKLCKIRARLRVSAHAHLPCRLPALAGVIALIAPCSAFGQIEYDMVLIEPWNTSYSLATSAVGGLNNLNQVTGCATPVSGSCSFMWTVESGKVVMDFAGPINDSGVMVISNWLRWPDGRLQEMVGAMHGAADINNANVVAGSDGSVFTCPLPPPYVNREATVWTVDGGTQLIEQTAGVPSADQAWAINDNNVIVGVRSSTGHCGDQKAFYYDLDAEQYIDLHSILVGEPDGITHAVDINNHETVIGDGPITMGGSAWLWNAATGVEILPDLPATDFGYSIPSSINDPGTVVGQAIVNDDWRAWIWDEVEGIRDLNEITYGIPEDFVIEEAKKINNNGWIIGRGHYGAWSPTRAVVLIPISARIPGDATRDGAVDADDLNAILSSWGMVVDAGDPRDVAHADGIVNIDDLNVVLSNWGADASTTR